MDDLIHLTLENWRIWCPGMALLDRANTETYGNPEITTVDIGVRSNPGILISGHDLRDMEMLLEQTQEPASMYTHTQRCFRRSIIRHLRNIRILRVITAMHGGVRRRNLRRVQRTDPDDDELHRAAEG